MGSGLEGAREGLDLLDAVVGERTWLGFAAAVGPLGRVLGQAPRVRAHPVVEDGMDQLARLVDRARRDAGGGDLPEQEIDLARRDLARRPVAEGAHDPAGGMAGAAEVGDTRLGQLRAQRPERRGLGPPHVGQPREVIERDLAERDAAPLARRGVLLDQRPVGVVLADQGEHPLVGLGFGQAAVVDPATTHPPTAVTVGFGPRSPERAHHRLATPRPLCVPVDPASALAQIWPRRRIRRCHISVRASGIATTL